MHLRFCFFQFLVCLPVYFCPVFCNFFSRQTRECLKALQVVTVGAAAVRATFPATVMT